VAASCAVVAGCGGAPRPSSGPTRAQLERYLRQVEPIRLSVNRLLEGADPILAALHEHRISPSAAALQMNRLEHRFAQLTVEVTAIESASPELERAHTAYAATYLQEDAYLSALVTGLGNDDLSDLPNTQAQQRAHIIGWRTDLAVFARKAHLRLPADLELAGRGEIAPSAQGGS
jgi:hypothetical protein